VSIQYKPQGLYDECSSAGFTVLCGLHIVVYCTQRVWTVVQCDIIMMVVIWDEQYCIIAIELFIRNLIDF